MPWTIDASPWFRQTRGGYIFNGNSPTTEIPESSSAISMNLSLTTAGRLGFFIDYSERTTVGAHTFYAARTHGSTGAVGCTWTAYDSAGGAQLSTGSLSWANTSLDVLSFTVNVASKPAGDHRIYVLLSSPTGGALLHHGTSTVAYGIIEDGTLATTNAIYIDAGAATNGTGTAASPYNNWYSARDALLVTDRVMYIKGLMIPNATDSVAFGAPAKNFGLLTTFGGRTSESQRLVIRNWAGFTGGITGGGLTDTTGFTCNGQLGIAVTTRFITFRNLSCIDLDNSAGNTVSGVCGFLRTRSSGGDLVEDFTAENITVDGILSGATSNSAVWLTEEGSRFKLWRWSVTNAININNIPLFILEAYRTDNISVQRCTGSQTAGSLYEKEGIQGLGGVGLSARFNVLSGGQIRIQTQGNSNALDFHIIQNNVFDTTAENNFSAPIGFFTSSGLWVTSKQHISSNVFYNYDFGGNGHMRSKSAGWGGIIMYNNIFYESLTAWRFDTGVDVAEYIDYNHYQNDVLTNQPLYYYFGPTPYTDLASLRAAEGFDIQSTVGTPVFTNAGSGDFTVPTNSNALSSGVSGTQKGVYLAPFINIGAN